jgi:hypothetical protein
MTRDFEPYGSTVLYTAAIRQAPHPLLSFCVLTTQIRRLLACDLLLVPSGTFSRAPTFNNINFGARYIDNGTKHDLECQDKRYETLILTMIQPSCKKRKH